MMKIKNVLMIFFILSFALPSFGSLGIGYTSNFQSKFIDRNFKGKKIVVAGATGDIGFNFVKYLVNNTKSEIIALNRSSSDVSKLEKIEGNIRLYNCGFFNLISLDHILSQSDFFFYCAGALKKSDPSLKEIVGMFVVNSFVPALISKIIQKKKHDLPFIYISSTAVYDIPDRVDVKKWLENIIDEFKSKVKIDLKSNNIYESIFLFIQSFLLNNPIPKNVDAYDLSKYLGEFFVLEACNSSCARLSNIYGPGYEGERLIKRMIDARLTGNGCEEKEQKRDYVYVDDLNESLLNLISLDKFGFSSYRIFDLVSERKISTSEIKDLILKNSKTFYGEMKINEAQGKKSEEGKLVCLNEKRDILELLSLFDIEKSITNFEQGIQKTVHYNMISSSRKNQKFRKEKLDFIGPGETFEGELHGSSSGHLIILKQGSDRWVRKLALRDGVEGNGIAKLKAEISKLKYIMKNFPELSNIYVCMRKKGEEYCNGETTTGEVWFDMPYIENGQNVLEYFFNNIDWNNQDFFNALSELLKIAIPFGYAKDMENLMEADKLSQFEELYIGRIKRGLEDISKFFGFCQISVNGQKFQLPLSIISSDFFLKKQDIFYPNINSFCTHGDATFLNMVIDKSSGEAKIKFIDSRGVIGLWDPLYDFGKMLCSLCGFYNMINGNYEVFWDKKGNIDLVLCDKSVDKLEKMILLAKDFLGFLEQNKDFAVLRKKEPNWKKRIIFACIAHFIADSSFRLGTDRNEESALIAYSLGTMLLNFFVKELQEDVFDENKFFNKFISNLRFKNLSFEVKPILQYYNRLIYEQELRENFFEEVKEIILKKTFKPIAIENAKNQLKLEEVKVKLENLKYKEFYENEDIKYLLKILDSYAVYFSKASKIDDQDIDIFADFLSLFDFIRQRTKNSLARLIEEINECLLVKLFGISKVHLAGVKDFMNNCSHRYETSMPPVNVYNFWQKNSENENNNYSLVLPVGGISSRIGKKIGGGHKALDNLLFFKTKLSDDDIGSMSMIEIILLNRIKKFKEQNPKKDLLCLIIENIEKRRLIQKRLLEFCKKYSQFSDCKFLEAVQEVSYLVDSNTKPIVSRKNRSIPDHGRLPFIIFSNIDFIRQTIIKNNGIIAYNQCDNPGSINTDEYAIMTQILNSINAPMAMMTIPKSISIEVEKNNLEKVIRVNKKKWMNAYEQFKDLNVLDRINLKQDVYEIKAVRLKKLMEQVTLVEKDFSQNGEELICARLLHGLMCLYEAVGGRIVNGQIQNDDECFIKLITTKGGAIRSFDGKNEFVQSEEFFGIYNLDGYQIYSEALRLAISNHFNTNSFVFNIFALMGMAFEDLEGLVKQYFLEENKIKREKLFTKMKFEVLKKLSDDHIDLKKIIDEKIYAKFYQKKGISFEKQNELYRPKLLIEDLVKFVSDYMCKEKGMIVICTNSDRNIKMFVHAKILSDFQHIFRPHAEEIMKSMNPSFSGFLDLTQDQIEAIQLQRNISILLGEKSYLEVRLKSLFSKKKSMKFDQKVQWNIEEEFDYELYKNYALDSICGFDYIVTWENVYKLFYSAIKEGQLKILTKDLSFIKMVELLQDERILQYVHKKNKTELILKFLDNFAKAKNLLLNLKTNNVN